MAQHDFDVVILGGGSGGYAAARTVTAAGLKTAVIDGGRELGGLCILRGCMPTKALLYAAEVGHLARHAATWGVRTGKVGFDFARVMARKDEQIKDFAGYRRRQLQGGKFQLIRSTAAFADPHTVTLADGTTVRGRHFVIATGSRVAAPPLPRLVTAGYWTSDDAVALRRLPRSLVILGGGAIACEFAQLFARLGVKVTLIQRSQRLLREFDTDTSRVVEGVFRAEGIRVYTGTTLLDARRTAKGRAVSFQHGGKTVTVTAERILFALGRVPDTAGLNLPAAGVRTSGGRILTNAGMQTSARHIYAAGDCTSPHEIVHLAVAQGEVAGSRIAAPASRRKMDYRLLISVVFTDPQVASAGLTEPAAAAAGLPFLSAQYPFDDHGKSLLMEARAGFVKLLAHPVTGEILGGGCVGPSGGELIHEIVAAMAKRMTVHELAAMPHYHPTLAEIWTYPAEELAEKIKPGKRRAR